MNTTEESGFDWVRARKACSVSQVFENLRLSVKGDVETRQALREKVEGLSYSESFQFSSKADRFSAYVDFVRSRRAVIFVLYDDRIAVLDDNDKELFAATVTLNKEKQCVLVVKGEEMEEWHFRKKALELLFFSQS
jgi:hypothetical protein